MEQDVLASTVEAWRWGFTINPVIRNPARLHLLTVQPGTGLFLRLAKHIDRPYFLFACQLAGSADHSHYHPAVGQVPIGIILAE